MVASRRLTAEGLPPEVEDAVTCCHALQDEVWVAGADTRWEVDTVLTDAPLVPAAASTDGCRAGQDAATPCCAS